MGREIRRVPLDFDWKLGKTWKGFVCPYNDYSHDCEDCDGTGYNPATRQLADDWYDNDGYGERWWYERDDKGYAIGIIEFYPGACRRWCDKLTQDEVDVLAKEGRFNHITSAWDEEKRKWVEKDPPVKVPVEEINEANAAGAMCKGHDALNRGICVEVRAKRLGVYGLCEHCQGRGYVITDPEMKKLADEWKPEGPLEGEGWQVWETVSEGSPVTPVFATPEKLIDYLVNVGIWGKRHTRKGAEEFVKEGWVPSAVGIPGVGYLDGIEAAPYLKKQT